MFEEGKININTVSQAGTAAANDGAMEFAVKLMEDSKLSGEYSDICLSHIEDENSDDKIKDWIKQQGYDTTPEDIQRAVEKLQQNSLMIWTNVN